MFSPPMVIASTVELFLEEQLRDELKPQHGLKQVCPEKDQIWDEVGRVDTRDGFKRKFRIKRGSERDLGLSWNRSGVEIGSAVHLGNLSDLS